jgi:hypothetical protein
LDIPLFWADLKKEREREREREREKRNHIVNKLGKKH